MSSMFEREVKYLLKELGKKDLRAVNSPDDATTLCQFKVLRKKKHTFLSMFVEYPDVPTQFCLMDILQPSASFPETSTTETLVFGITEARRGTLGAGVDVSAGLQAELLGEIATSHESSLECRFVKTPLATLTELIQRKLLKPEPWFLQQCRKRGENLYVVTDFVELTNSPTLKDSFSAKGSGNVSIPWNAFVKVKGQIGGLKDRKKMLTLKPGMVVGYKRRPLVIREDGCEILLHAHDDEEDTFQDDMFQSRLEEVRTLGRIEEPISQNFKALQNEVSQEVNALAQLPKDVQRAVFHNLRAILRDRKALQDLMDRLEEDSLDHLDGPGGTILRILQEKSKERCFNLKSDILCILEALMPLSDIQHDLLAQSMEMRILSGQRDLVRSILEPNFKYPWCIPFTLKPELLAPLQGKGLTITYGLLEACGLVVEPSTPRSTWDLEAKGPLSALYMSLSVLQQLAEA
ncbi:gasdermin-C isoform X2 [Dasypus novemcinctus]|uniref:gasdermin-C isoform X2 n=1 Tax=Dasypus novemcinctus TaxID=9361 RepID=UPI0039C961BF